MIGVRYLMTSNDSCSDYEFDLLGLYFRQDFPFRLMILPTKGGDKPSVDFFFSVGESI